MSRNGLKKVTTGNLVNEIVSVAGVSKDNAVSIMNLMTNAWNVDKIGFLRAVDTGIAIRKASTARKSTTAKKDTTAKKSTTAKKTTVQKAVSTKKTTTAQKNTNTVAPVAKKAKKKLKKNVSVPTTENTPAVEA